MDLETKAKEIRGSLLPSASKDSYQKEQKKFLDFLIENQQLEEPPTPSTILVYFHFLSQKFAPATLWRSYSILNGYFRITYGVDFRTHAPSVKAFLSRFKKESPKGKQKKL